MISFRLDPSSVRETQRIIREYERKVGQAADESLVDIGREAARQAAQKVPPFGLSENIGNKFKKSIAKQVNRAVKNANVTGKAGDAAKVHANARDSKGQVPKELQDTGAFKREPIGVADKERVIDQRQKAAGIVKGAWIHAGTLLGRKMQVVTGRKRQVVGKWIMRHLKRGQATITRMGMNTTITLTNTVGWVQKLQTEAMLNAAVRAAFRGKQKEMQRQLDKLT